VIRSRDNAGDVIETHEHKGDFKDRERLDVKSRHMGDVTADCSF